MNPKLVHLAISDGSLSECHIIDIAKMESEPQAPWYYLRPEWFHSTFDISSLPEDQLEGGRQELRRLIFKDQNDSCV